MDKFEVNCSCSEHLVTILGLSSKHQLTGRHVLNNHLIVESFLYHQSVSFQVEQIFRVHCDLQRYVTAGDDFHQLDVSRVVFRDRHGARRNGADWERREAADRFIGHQAWRFFIRCDEETTGQLRTQEVKICRLLPDVTSVILNEIYHRHELRHKFRCSWIN